MSHLGPIAEVGRYYRHVCFLDIAPMPKIPPAVRYTLDALLIVVPLILMTYFLFDPAAFNAFTAWLARVL
jgi:hypothetical protein